MSKYREDWKAMIGNEQQQSTENYRSGSVLPQSDLFNRQKYIVRTVGGNNNNNQVGLLCYQKATQGRHYLSFHMAGQLLKSCPS